MGESLNIYFVFERTPPPQALADAVAEWRRTCRFSGSEFASTVDPERDDAEIAEALLTDGQPYSLDAGYGDIHGSLWFHPSGLDERDGPGEYEGARTLPHAVFRIQDAYFYPDAGEGDAAVIERSEDLVGFVTRLYEGLAAHGLGPAYVYGALPGTAEELLDPDSDVSLSETEVTDGVPAAVFWLQAYPPRMVEQLGEHRLLSAPAWQTERLADGGVVVAVYETPSLYTGAEHSLRGVTDHIHGA